MARPDYRVDAELSRRDNVPFFAFVVRVNPNDPSYSVPLRTRLLYRMRVYSPALVALPRALNHHVSLRSSHE